FQQFINKKCKLNDDVNFLYETIPLEAGATFSDQPEMVVGVLTIRPHDDGYRYAEQTFGKVEKWIIWRRMGTTSKAVRPEELYQEGRKSVSSIRPKLVVELVDFATGQPINGPVEFQTRAIKMPKEIPLVSETVPTPFADDPIRRALYSGTVP